MRLFGWTAGEDGCAYYRVQLPFDQLAAAGHEVSYGMRMPDEARESADVIVAQRTAMPAPSILWQQLCGEGKRLCVYEVDDDLFNVDPSNRVPYQLFSQPEIRDLMRANIAASHLVTVTNEHLADQLRPINPNVVVLPNYIPARLLDQPAPEQGGQVTIGWGGGASHSRDFGEVAKPLKRVLQRLPDVTEFHCMGADYTPRVASARGRTRFTGWFEGVNDYLRSIDFHVGITPLRPHLFADSKSDIKLLEYAALGIPAVVSNTGPYVRALTAGAPALPASTARDWEQQLTRLAHDPDQRTELGKLAREWATTQTIEGNAHQWATTYQGAR